MNYTIKKGYTLVAAVMLCLCMGVNAQKASTYQLGTDKKDDNNQITWSGTVVSESDDEPIISAVLSSSSGINATTDIDGSFSIQLKKGTYQFKISALGFEDESFELVALSSGDLSFFMRVKQVLIGEVVIGGSRNESIKEITPGLQRLTTEQLESQSKFFGEIDILRSLQSISGVSNTGEGASGFNVRGGNTDQNLILQDGHLIFNPSHALGFFSLFHPDLIQYVDLYKGGIPAKYGGRLSSVLAVATREGSKEEYKLKGGIGMVSSRLTAEGPIIKDKLSFIIASRYSYADWIFGLVNDPNLAKSRAFFNDITANLNGRLTKTTNVGVSFLRSKDDFQLGEETRFDYSTISGEGYIKQLIGDKINLTARINRGRYESSLFDLKGNDQSKFTNAIDYTRASLDMLYALTDKNKVNIGAELNLYDVSPGEVIPIGIESIIIPDQLAIEKAREIAFYAENQLNLADKVDLSIGLRFTQFSNVGADEVFSYPENVIRTERNITGSTVYSDGETIATYTGLEPRISLRYEVNEATSVKLGYARTYQYLAQISNTASATPIDIWQVSNQYVKPQYSDNYSIGLFKNFANSKYETSGEIFYRQATGILDYKEFADLLLNPHIETELVTGVGKSYGVEFNVKKNLGSVTWDANYTFTRSLRRVETTATQKGINKGNWYSSNYDIPHVFNVSMVKQFGKKSNLAVNFTYRSGRPTTAPVSSYTSDNVINVPIYSDRNQFRVPDFHRLDVAYTIGPFAKENAKWGHSITFSIYNLYSRRNAYSVYFRQNPFDSVKAIRVATLGTIFPSITYNFTIN